MELIRTRAMESFSSLYMTMVSLIEAIALELLVGRVQSLSGLGQLSIDSLVTWLQIVFMFEVVLGIWVAYAILTTATRWATTLLDSTTVFALGVWQFFAIGWIGDISIHHWLYFTCIGAAIALVIVRSAYASAAREPGNERFVESFPIKFLTNLVVGWSCTMLPVAVLVHLGVGGKWLAAAALAVGIVGYANYIRTWSRWWKRSLVREAAEEKHA